MPEFAFAAGAVAPNAGMIDASASGPSAPKAVTVRSVFPETWLWTNSTAGYLIRLIIDIGNARKYDCVVLRFFVLELSVLFLYLYDIYLVMWFVYR